MTRAELEPLRQWLREHTGLQTDRLGPQRLERAVDQRWRLQGCTDASDYVQQLPRDRKEQQRLVEQLVVGESWFLREPRSFDQLCELARQERSRPLRLLSCGCAGGEEPYSMVIALLEAGLPLDSFQVEAIDISAVALGRAAEGLFGSHALRSMPPTLLKRHFQPEDQRWRLNPPLRNAVRFHQGDLQQQLAMLAGNWQVVFCRNVMLYFDDQARQRLLKAIAGRLAPQGMLVVAAAEALMVPREQFANVGGGHGAAFRPSPSAPMGTATAPAPRSAGEHLALARQLQRRGQAEQALASLRRCLYLEPELQEALELAATVAEGLGRRQEADRQRRRLRRQQGER